MTHERTYSLEKLYHKFLKQKNIPIEKLPIFVSKLYQAGFIDVFRSPEDPDVERYSETEKLRDRRHADELFSIVQSLIS